MKPLDFFKNWRKDEICAAIRQHHQQYDQYSEIGITVNTAIKSIEHSPLLDHLLTCKLYQDLLCNFGLEEATKTVIYILDNDPSRYQKSAISIEYCLTETPFPRYLVSICYSLLYHQCISYKGCDLGDSIWKNILDTGNMMSIGKPMFVILQDYFSDLELFNRSIDLIGEDKKLSNNIGDSILYYLFFSEAISRDKMINSIRHKAETEEDVSKAKRYRAYLRKHSKFSIKHVLSKIFNSNFV